MLNLKKNLFLKIGLLTILWSMTNIDHIFPVNSLNTFHENQIKLDDAKYNARMIEFSRLGPVRAVMSAAKYMKPAASKAAETARPYLSEVKQSVSKFGSAGLDAAGQYLIGAKDYLDKNQKADDALKKTKDQFYSKVRQEVAAAVKPLTTKTVQTAQPFIDRPNADLKKTGATSPRLKAPAIPKNIPRLTGANVNQSATPSWWTSLTTSIGSGLNSAKSFFSSPTPTISPTASPTTTPIIQTILDSKPTPEAENPPFVIPISPEGTHSTDAEYIEESNVKTPSFTDTDFDEPQNPLIDPSYYKKGKLAAGIIGATLAAGAIARKAKRLPVETEIKIYELIGKIINTTSEKSVAAATKLGKTANKMSHYWKEGKIPLGPNARNKLAEYLSSLNDYDRAVWYNRLKSRLFDQDLNALVLQTNGNISSRVYPAEPQRFDWQKIADRFPTIKSEPTPEYPLMVRPGDAPIPTSTRVSTPQSAIKLGTGDASHLGDGIKQNRRKATYVHDLSAAISKLRQQDPSLYKKLRDRINELVTKPKRPEPTKDLPLQITPDNTIHGVRFGNETPTIRPPEPVTVSTPPVDITIPGFGQAGGRTTEPLTIGHQDKPLSSKFFELVDYQRPPESALKQRPAQLQIPPRKVAAVTLGDGKPLTRGQKAAITRAKNKAERDRNVAAVTLGDGKPLTRGQKAAQTRAKNKAERDRKAAELAQTSS